MVSRYFKYIITFVFPRELLQKIRFFGKKNYNQNLMAANL